MQKVWLDGELIDAEKAKVGILTHSLQYGSGIFEGIRSYSIKKNSRTAGRIEDPIPGETRRIGIAITALLPV